MVVKWSVNDRNWSKMVGNGRKIVENAVKWSKMFENDCKMVENGRNAAMLRKLVSVECVRRCR